MTILRRLVSLVRFDPLTVDELAQRARDHQGAIEAAQGTLGSLDGRLGSTEVRLDRLESLLGQLEQRLDQANARFDAELNELRSCIDATAGAVEERQSRQLATVQDRLSSALSEVVADLERVREGLDGDLKALRGAAVEIEHRLDGLEDEQRGTSAELARVRDQILPATVERSDVLLDRLCEQMEELGSLVERILLREPLPVAAAEWGDRDEQAIAGELAAVQPHLLERFRGDREEILHRQEWYAQLLAPHTPVLDLGCGRGELLELMREHGIEAVGVESDPALAAGARRRGLRVLAGDVLELLRAQEAESWGAVTALHLLEHLRPVELQRCLCEIQRVLKPGGVLAAECPNPHSLRVGGTLFWIDPTHDRPLLPETLELFMRAAGLRPEAPRWRHPFPEEQRWTVSVPPVDDPSVARVWEAVQEMARRIDELVNGFRDYVLIAQKPGADTGDGIMPQGDDVPATG